MSKQKEQLSPWRAFEGKTETDTTTLPPSPPLVFEAGRRKRNLRRRQKKNGQRCRRTSRKCSHKSKERELFLREHSTSYAKCLQKVLVTCVQKRSLGLCSLEEMANLPGHFQRKIGTEPDCQKVKRGEMSGWGDRHWRQLFPEAELRRGERYMNWEGGRF